MFFLFEKSRLKRLLYFEITQLFLKKPDKVDENRLKLKAKIVNEKTKCQFGHRKNGEIFGIFLSESVYPAMLRKAMFPT
jgi:hypothetical protein